MNREAKAITLINQRNRELQRQTLSQVKHDDTNKEDDPFTRKSQRMKPVAGKAKNITDLPEKKEEDKNPINNLKQPSLTHSSSAPILSSLNPSLLLDVIPDDIPRNSPIPTLSSTNSSTNKAGSLSLAEWKRRKAEAAAAAGK
uniref:Uncharacterized protein n=1 Tax=Panagrolaimus sp. JU765 TaxID=591449 RepID=A0AC34R425_9BILA